MRTRNAILWATALLCCALPTLADGLTIADAKLLPNDSSVSLSAKVVTYASTDFFYVEEDDQTCGIRVEKVAHGLTVGVRVDVEGTLQTNGDNERYIAATSCASNGAGTIEPLFMNNKAVGGWDWQYDSATGKGQIGISGAVGLNNIGLLVRIQGRVMQGAPGDTEPMYVDDGSGAHVRVVLPPGVTSPGYGARIAASGVVSCVKLHHQVTGPTNPTYQDFQQRVVLATSVETVAAAPVWNFTGEMVYIPAGSFLMGNSGVGNDLYYDQVGACVGEKPQHSVYLSAYYIGKYEVTRGEYRAFVNAGGYSNPAYWSSDGWSWRVNNSRTQPGYWDAVQDFGAGPFTQTDNHPVVGVSYYEAEAFCAWAGGHLPTEAQWERAARWTGSHPNVYPWGGTWNDEYCNNYWDSNPAGGGYGSTQTAPVGSYSNYGSPSGCQDMAGNVWELCKDWYWGIYYSQSPSSDPQGPASGKLRVLRGGCWSSTGNYGRCAYRGRVAPDSLGWDDSGFRLAR